MKNYRFLPLIFLFAFTFSADDRADAVANRVYDALGGKTAWSKVRYLGFQFGSMRNGQRPPPIKHLWDRHTGDYRVEWKKGADTTVTVLFNVNTKQGNAFYKTASTSPSRAADAEQAALLTRAYGRFINDTYWLLMPIKLMDDGVTRTFASDSSNATHDVINLSFDNVGLTPKDRYWVYVNKTSGLVDKWAYILQSNRDGKATTWEWTDYAAYPTNVGTLKLSSRKVNRSSGAELLTDGISFPESVGDALTKP